MPCYSTANTLERISQLLITMTNPFCSQYGICRDPTAPPGHPNNPLNAITQDHFTDGAFLGHFMQNHACPGLPSAAPSAALEPEHHYHIFHGFPPQQPPPAAPPYYAPPMPAPQPGGMSALPGGPYAMIPAADVLKLAGGAKDEKEKEKKDTPAENRGPPVHYHRDQHVHFHGRDDRSAPPFGRRPRPPFVERVEEYYAGERMGRGLRDGEDDRGPWFGAGAPRGGRRCPGCREGMARRRGMWYCEGCRIWRE